MVRPAYPHNTTLRWDLKEAGVNKKLEEVIIKTIAAFANSQGGTLLIGVADDGDVIGLEPDISRWVAWIGTDSSFIYAIC